MIKTAY
jgi:ADP-sugar diphosphatase